MNFRQYISKMTPKGWAMVGGSAAAAILFLVVVMNFASQQLATGQLTDPTQAITSVENASLAMDLASQIRTKLVDAVNTVFQTQV